MEGAKILRHNGMIISNGGNIISHDPSKIIQYGFLYNKYAVEEQGSNVWLIGDDMRAEGWKIPISNVDGESWVVGGDFYDLKEYLTGSGFPGQIGDMIKEEGYEYWEETNTGTNTVDFNARGSGYRQSGIFYFLKNVFSVLSTRLDDGGSFPGRVEVNFPNFNFDNVSGNKGSSIRLVRAATTGEQLLSDGTLQGVFYYGNDNKKYRVTKIGNQVWLGDNLAETKWSNGNWIPGFNNGTYTSFSDTQWRNLSAPALCAYNNDESLAYK